jgi:plasmid stabilization system protein ParE
MEYQVELTVRSRLDIEAIFDHIHEDAPLNAVRWRRGLEKKLAVLERIPNTFTFAIENRDAPCEVRQIFYGRYRILYTVEAGTVHVLTIRHGARLPMSQDELRRIVP